MQWLKGLLPTATGKTKVMPAKMRLQALQKRGQRNLQLRRALPEPRARRFQLRPQCVRLVARLLRRREDIILFHLIFSMGRDAAAAAAAAAAGAPRSSTGLRASDWVVAINDPVQSTPRFAYRARLGSDLVAPQQRLRLCARVAERALQPLRLARVLLGGRAPLALVPRLHLDAHLGTEHERETSV